METSNKPCFDINMDCKHRSTEQRANENKEWTRNSKSILFPDE